MEKQMKSVLDKLIEYILADQTIKINQPKIDGELHDLTLGRIRVKFRKSDDRTNHLETLLVDNSLVSSGLPQRDIK